MMHYQQKFLTGIGIIAIGWGLAVTGLAGAGLGAPTVPAATPLVLSDITQTLSLTGALYRYEPANPKAAPPPLPGYRVYLYSRQANRWIGPSITDSYGRYAFYDVDSGTYLLRIYPTGYRGEADQSQVTQAVQPHIWQQEVRVPGTVKPIVLRNPTALRR